MKINERFKKGYYINLDRRIERKNQFESEMEKYGLSGFFERVPAEDAGNIPNFVMRHHHCSLTYHKLFKKIYDEGHDEVVIFEDDAFFYNGGERPAVEIISDALIQLNNFEWDLFYFGGLPGKKMEIVSPNLALCPYILTTHAIAYKRHVIKRVLDQFHPFIDSAIDGWYAYRPDIKKYIITPLAIPQREGESDLDASGNSVGISMYLHSFKTTEKNL
jgi:hypothetical protein